VIVALFRLHMKALAVFCMAVGLVSLVCIAVNVLVGEAVFFKYPLSIFLLVLEVIW